MERNENNDYKATENGEGEAPNGQRPTSVHAPVAFGCQETPYKMSQLKGCKWVTYDREKETNTIWFTDSTYYDESFYPTLNKTTTIELPFYLSNTIEKVFDESKVGTNTSGKYLIIKEGNAKYGYNLVVCEIMGISNTNLSIKHGIYTAKKKIGFAKFILNFTKVPINSQAL